jgi:hypothetical protein
MKTTISDLALDLGVFALDNETENEGTLVTRSTAMPRVAANRVTYFESKIPRLSKAGWLRDPEDGPVPQTRRRGGW